MAEHEHNDMMTSRGVTRPMAEMHPPEHHRAQPVDMHHERHARQVPDKDAEPAHDGHAMSPEMRLSMLQTHHRQTLWIYWTIVLLGICVMMAPFTFGYRNAAAWVNPSGGRGVWFSDQTHAGLRASLMVWSDLVSGLLLVIFGWRSLTPNRSISLWMCCGVGIWLTLAPVLFWAPTAAAYLSDTLIGVLVIALTILIPGMPNMIMYMQHGPATPPGWSYNPSSWPQRWIMIVTGFAGWIVSRYVAAFQLGYTNHVWDPLFGFENGAQQVLNSNMSHGWPISDGGMGALAYTFEFLMGWMGGPARWRTMPWMVAFFGILVIPLGLTHIFLVISQPVVVHHWCAMCLLAAAIMLPMIPLEVDEVVAMGQHLVDAKRRGDRGGSLWRIFWLGGSAAGCTPDERSPELIDLPRRFGAVFRSSIWGMTFPWTLVGAAIVGLLLMCTPTWCGVDIHTTAADIGHLGGALILTVSVVCMGEVLRIGRWLNVPIALLVATAPWFLNDVPLAFCAICSVSGAAVTGLSVRRGPKRDFYGTWDQYIR